MKMSLSKAIILCSAILIPHHAATSGSVNKKLTPMVGKVIINRAPMVMQTEGCNIAEIQQAIINTVTPPKVGDPVILITKKDAALKGSVSAVDTTAQSFTVTCAEGAFGSLIPIKRIAAAQSTPGAATPAAPSAAVPTPEQLAQMQASLEKSVEEFKNTEAAKMVAYKLTTPLTGTRHDVKITTERKTTSPTDGEVTDYPCTDIGATTTIWMQTNPAQQSAFMNKKTALNAKQPRVSYDLNGKAKQAIVNYSYQQASELYIATIDLNDAEAIALDRSTMTRMDLTRKTLDEVVASYREALTVTMAGR